MPSRPSRLRSTPILSGRRARSVLAVFGGGLIGSGTRETIGRLLTASADRFPIEALSVNLAGSLLLGFYLARRERAATRPRSLQFWAIGVMGSFTTFSAFSFDVVRLIDAREGGVAATYVLISIAGGLACTQLGQRLGRIG